jgi:NAD(P)-dependent dehydrogenase (short-subunit alcohol dehydrogenase family)
MMDFSGKTAIVTGAGSGIGLSIATALAEAGANVVTADIQKAAVEEAARRLSGTNKRVMPVRADVTLEQSTVDALAEAERAFGKLHIACNNAGVPMHGTRLTDVPPEDWAFVIGVNVWGIIHRIRHFVPAIRSGAEQPLGHALLRGATAPPAKSGSSKRRGQGPPRRSGNIIHIEPWLRSDRVSRSPGEPVADRGEQRLRIRDLALVAPVRGLLMFAIARTSRSAVRRRRAPRDSSARRRIDRR